MSFITVQVGQCGNQLGNEVFSKIKNEASNQVEEIETCIEESFFKESTTGQAEARAVLVDTEPKVVDQCCARKGPQALWSYDPNCKVSSQGGAGNNWGHGYTGYGPAMSEDILDAVSRQAEQCDWLAGFIVAQSVAGGTGSGLGTYLTEVLAEEYPGALTVNLAVCPYSTGEVILQNYNACLTLSRVARASDAVLLLENSVFNRLAAKVLGPQSQRNPSLHDLNSVMALQVASVFLPAYQRHSERNIWALNDSLQHLCGHQGYNVLTSSMVPQVAEEAIEFSSDSWQALNKRLYQMNLCGKHVESEIDWSLRSRTKVGMEKQWSSSLANITFSRGTESENSEPKQFSEEIHRYPVWYDSPSISCWTPSGYHGHDKFVSLLSNSQACLEFLDQTTMKAYEMFESQAYVHQYTTYGLQHQDFMDSFAQMEQIIVNYQSLDAPLS
mmetsp:Transcript_13118/g.17159  ORF Transcript_13118/g.17159 Transcript_13118/m.17159 type:complete len:442 (+) Transcript_13118:62-1387(+)|eukprot:CAMPEP_0117806932 /NCGR_PEP_ID=MMETSP0948-20121206/18939_1 /TAXON_ID=44440 /ORGANISM="Chattonella subsalsa, Strain CCMP2191" /LENGTH=441 /DNA_ID=CAMNT_0005641655 /DNA_START=15 /DNA_END=1340 /DNA_ORIENTATION=-